MTSVELEVGKWVSDWRRATHGPDAGVLHVEQPVLNGSQSTRTSEEPSNNAHTRVGIKHSTAQTSNLRPWLAPEHS